MVMDTNGTNLERPGSAIRAMAPGHHGKLKRCNRRVYTNTPFVASNIYGPQACLILPWGKLITMAIDSMIYSHKVLVPNFHP